MVLKPISKFKEDYDKYMIYWLIILIYVLLENISFTQWATLGASAAAGGVFIVPRLLLMQHVHRPNSIVNHDKQGGTDDLFHLGF